MVQIHLAKLLLFTEKEILPEQICEKAGFLSVYDASIFAIYQMIFSNSLTFVNNLDKKLYNIKRQIITQ